jgi:hypothetical protein
MINATISGEPTLPPFPIIEHDIDPEIDEVGKPELGTEIDSRKLHTKLIALVGYLYFLPSESP